MQSTLVEVIANSACKTCFTYLILMTLPKADFDQFKKSLEALDETDELIKIGLRCGDILSYCSESIIQSIKRFVISFICENQFHEAFSKFITACCNNRQLSRSDVITEILLISSVRIF